MKLLTVCSVLLSSVLLFSCAENENKDNNDLPNNIISKDKAVTQSISNVQATGYTYHSQDGNRFVEGKGTLNTITPIDIPLPASAVWISAISTGQKSYWAVVLDTGQVKAYSTTAQGYEEVDISPSQLSAIIPPTLVMQADDQLKLANVFDDGSTVTSSVVLNNDGDRAYVATNGDVVLKNSNGEQRLAVSVLPYARLLMDEKQRLLVLTNPSNRYAHRAVLGSAYDHATEITMIETQPVLKIARRIVVSAPDVVEGNALIWRDTDGDGQREIITTLSRAAEGGRIVVFNEDGSLRNQSSPIGIDFRWRHQVAVAPFRSSSEVDLLSVYIPHLGPRIEVFRLDDNSMTEQSKSVNYSSHLRTGLNIDMGISGDFDNDGKVELLLVERFNQTLIGAFEYMNGSIQKEWTIQLTNSISSNVAAVTLDDNSIAFGVGQGNNLRVWQP